MEAAQDLTGDGVTRLGRTRRLRADRARQVADVLRRQVLHGLVGDGLAAVGERRSRTSSGSPATPSARRWTCSAPRGWSSASPASARVVAGSKYLHGIDHLQGLAETLDGPRTGPQRGARLGGLVPAPAAVARRLGLAPGEQVVYLERRRFVDDVPLSLDLTYVVQRPRRAAARGGPRRPRRVRAARADRRAAASARPSWRSRRSPPTATPPRSSTSRAAPRCSCSSDSPASTTAARSTSSSSASGATGSPCAAPSAAPPRPPPGELSEHAP